MWGGKHWLKSIDKKVTINDIETRIAIAQQKDPVPTPDSKSPFPRIFEGAKRRIRAAVWRLACKTSNSQSIQFCEQRYGIATRPRDW